MSTIWGCDTTARDTAREANYCRRNLTVFILEDPTTADTTQPQSLRNLPHSNAVHNPCPKREPLPFAFKLACLAVGSFLVGWLGLRLYGHWILWKH